MCVHWNCKLRKRGRLLQRSKVTQNIPSREISSVFCSHCELQCCTAATGEAEEREGRRDGDEIWEIFTQLGSVLQTKLTRITKPGGENLLWSSRGDFGSVGERQSEVTPARAAPREVPGGWRRDPAASSVPDPSRLSPGGSRGAWLSSARAARLIFSSVPSLAPAPTSSPRSASRPPPQHALCKRCGTIWG